MKDIQLFLSFANFYQKFICWYSEIAALLLNLTKKDRKFEWTSEEEEAFLALKEMFIKGSILVMFKSVKKIVVKTDASKITLGAMLSQSDKEGKLHPVVFYLRKFTLPKMNYNIYNKELLIIINSFKIWRVYLKELKHIVQVYIDYKNLKTFISIKVLN